MNGQDDKQTQTSFIDGDHKEKMTKCELMLYKTIYEMNQILKNVESATSILNELNSADENEVSLNEQDMLSCEIAYDDQNSDANDGMESEKEIIPDNLTPQRIKNLSNNKMVKIGKHSEIPKEIYNKIKWNDFRKATNQLLESFFSRKTLATHSLTGTNLRRIPPKQKLDETITEDITSTIVKMCNISKSEARYAITKKCNAEANSFERGLNRRESLPKRNVKKKT